MFKQVKKVPKNKKKADKNIKRVFFFGAGKAEAKGEMLSKSVLGGKGLGLMEMTSIGLPVPGGFTITIQTCEEYYKLGRKLPKGLQDEVKQSLAKLEKATGKKFGDPNDPLLVSVRSGAARSMPGMLETILNLGLNDQSVEGLAAKTGNAALRLRRLPPLHPDVFHHGHGPLQGADGRHAPRT